MSDRLVALQAVIKNALRSNGLKFNHKSKTANRKLSGFNELELLEAFRSAVTELFVEYIVRIDARINALKEGKNLPH